jgi:hypothetical protein
MGLMPNIKKKSSFVLKSCSHCGQSSGSESFAPTKSLFYPDGVIPICNSCVEHILAQHDYDWAVVDKICQLADVPFVPKEWERLREMTETDLFYRYASIFMSADYEGLGWSDYHQAFLDLKRQNRLEAELPEIADEKRKKLKEKWGGNYDDEALGYLENLFNGLMTTQNVNGSLQIDQALKICKMSYEIDRRIAEGTDFDKLLSSYDKLVKSAEFTPKNVKNINDFDTFGEATKYMEKCGWRNTFYDGVTRDIVDESIKNFQAFNQRLYINESNIGEEITRRLESLKHTAEMENYYGTDKKQDLDAFEQEGYEIVFEGEDDDFIVEDED